MAKRYYYTDPETKEKKSITLKADETGPNLEKVQALSRAGLITRSELLDDTSAS